MKDDKEMIEHRDSTIKQLQEELARVELNKSPVSKTLYCADCNAQINEAGDQVVGLSYFETS